MLEKAKGHAAKLLGLKTTHNSKSGAGGTVSWVAALSIGATIVVCCCALGVCMLTRHQMEQRLAIIMREVAEHRTRKRARWTDDVVPAGERLSPTRLHSPLSQQLKSRQQTRHALPAVTAESMFSDEDEERQGLVSEVEPVFGSSSALFAQSSDALSQGVGAGADSLAHSTAQWWQPWTWQQR